MCFSWLLSDIGEANPSTLLSILPALFENRNKTTIPNFDQQFSKYWNRVGIPEEQEGAAIDLLFQWLIDPKVNVSIKSNALEVLVKVLEKYPDLKTELKLMLEDSNAQDSAAFQKKKEKILRKIDT